MQCSTKTKVLRVLNLVVILSLCIWVKHKNDKAKEMIEWNTKIINSIGVVSFTQSQNADVLINIITEMDREPINKEEFGSRGGVFVSLEDESIINRPIPKKQDIPVGAEESQAQEPFSSFAVDENGLEELPASFDQVIEDLKRIDLSVRAFASNNLFQKQSLDLIYQRISSGRIELDELNEDEVYYIIEENRYDDEFVQEVTETEVDDHQWSFVVSNGVEDEN